MGEVIMEKKGWQDVHRAQGKRGYLMIGRIINKTQKLLVVVFVEMNLVHKCKVGMIRMSVYSGRKGNITTSQSPPWISVAPR